MSKQNPVYTINITYLPDMVKKIESFENRHGVKVEYSYEIEQKKEETVVYVEFDLTQLEPAINGMSFVGIMEFIPQEGKVSRLAPDNTLTIDERETITPIRCDYCHMRHIRSEVCLLRDSVGKLVVAGKDCTEKILGMDPKKLLLAKWLIDFIPQVGRPDSGGSGVYDLRETLTYAIVAIARYGYVSASSEHMAPTHARVSKYLADKEAYKADRAITTLPFTARDVIEWAKTLAYADTEYLRNLEAVARSDYFTANQYKLVVSMAYAYQKRLDQKQPAPKFASGLQTISGIVTRKAIKSGYMGGNQTYYTIETQNGRINVNQVAFNSTWSEGDTVTFICDVKVSDDNKYVNGLRPKPAKTKI